MLGQESCFCRYLLRPSIVCQCVSLCRFLCSCARLCVYTHACECVCVFVKYEVFCLWFWKLFFPLFSVVNDVLFSCHTHSLKCNTQLGLRPESSRLRPFRRLSSKRTTNKFVFLFLRSQSNHKFQSRR